MDTWHIILTIISSNVFAILINEVIVKAKQRKRLEKKVDVVVDCVTWLTTPNGDKKIIEKRINEKLKEIK